MRSWRSPWLLTVLCVVFAALAGLLIASHASGPFALVLTVLAFAAAMASGGYAALQLLRLVSPRPISADEADITVEMPVVGADAPCRTSQSPPGSGALLHIVGSFVAASAATVALLVATVSWTSSRGLPEAPATLAPATATLADSIDLQAPLETPVAPVPAEQVKVRVDGHRIDSSRVRRECLAQIESAHLFLTMAREARGAGAYAQSTNTQIKRFSASRPIDPRTLQHIALRMWEQRHAPDRGPLWWSGQYSRCEEARVAGSGYTVRG